MTSYLGNNEEFSDAIVRYANNYANVVESDYEQFRTACRTGVLQAQTEVDFKAQVSI
jgi:hypothetical protein